jgi:hypothetical protein
VLTRNRAALTVVATAGLSLLAMACTSSSPEPEPQPSSVASDETTATPSTTAPPSPETWNGMTGEEIVTQAREALEDVATYRVEGTLVEGAGRITLDLVYAGDRRHGTRSQGDASAEMIQIEGTTYVTGNLEYWERIVYSQTAELLVGEWVELDGPYATFGAALAPDLETLLTPTGLLQPGEEATINGQSAITVTDGRITIAVATEDPTYPLRIEAEDGTRLDVSDFGQLVTIDAPTDALSLAAVTGSG